MANMLPALLGLATLSLPAPSNDLDFWVGEWSCSGKSRNAPGKDQWTPTKASNSITRTLNGKVIQEKFQMDGFKGQSWSVYDVAAKRWKQTWVDDSGAYLVFEGGRVGDSVILHTLPSKASPKTISRMVFRDIMPASFTWNWEKTTDGGKSWELQWTLTYTRKD